MEVGKMKTRNVILSVIAIIALCECTKESKEPYPNEYIVRDNAQAALYFHTVFREAENAWAFIDSVKYKSGVYADQSNPSPAVKNLTYNESTNIVTVEYNAWVSNNLLLVGTISVKFVKDSYRMNTYKASVYLTDFSIEGYNIVGEFTIGYREVNNSTNDHYTFEITDGAIHEKGSSKPVLISGSVTNGQYERVEGNKKFLQDDDTWAYTGTMTGTLRDDPNQKYTNTVLTEYTYIAENGEEKNGIVHYSFGDCTTATSGVSQIKISGRSDIIYGYFCKEIDFLSVTRVD